MSESPTKKQKLKRKKIIIWSSFSGLILLTIIGGYLFYNHIISGLPSLEELEKPERIAQIERQWEEKKKRSRRKAKKLVQILTDVEFEDDPGREDGCLICQL